MTETEKKEATPKSEVALVDGEGRETGVVVTVGAPTAGDDAEDGDRVASAIKGWTKLTLDGEELKYSRESARHLVARFPWLAQAVREKARIK